MELEQFCINLEDEEGYWPTTPSGEPVYCAAIWDVLLDYAKQEDIDVPRDPSMAGEVLNMLGIVHDWVEYIEDAVDNLDGSSHEFGMVCWR